MKQWDSTTKYNKQISHKEIKIISSKSLSHALTEKYNFQQYLAENPFRTRLYSILLDTSFVNVDSKNSYGILVKL